MRWLKTRGKKKEAFTIEWIRTKVHRYASAVRSDSRSKQPLLNDVDGACSFVLLPLFSAGNSKRWRTGEKVGYRVVGEGRTPWPLFFFISRVEDKEVYSQAASGIIATPIISCRARKRIAEPSSDDRKWMGNLGTFQSIQLYLNAPLTPAGETSIPPILS